MSIFSNTSILLLATFIIIPVIIASNNSSDQVTIKFGEDEMTNQEEHASVKVVKSDLDGRIANLEESYLDTGHEFSGCRADSSEEDSDEDAGSDYSEEDDDNRSMN